MDLINYGGLVTHPTTHAKCDLKVIWKVKPPKQLKLMKTSSDWNNIDIEYNFQYECPIHGRLNAVPDEDIIDL